MIPQKLIEDVMALDDADLRNLNTLIVERIRATHRVKNYIATRELWEGCRVKFIGRPGKGLRPGILGTVQHLNRTTVGVKFDGDWRIWKVSPTLLERVTEQPSANTLVAGILGMPKADIDAVATDEEEIA